MSNSPAEIVTSETSLKLLIPGSESVTIPVTLKYNPEDPYATTITFGGDGLAVDWVFARELLAAGQSGPAGTGDVKTQPSSTDPGVMVIMLTSPDGTATLMADIATIAEFLDKTYEVVPAGEESVSSDLDAALKNILL